MKFRRKDKSYHRRDWRRLWRYCRCGFRWTCPDRAPQVPMPHQPAPIPPLTRATYRAAVRASVPAPVVVTPDVPPPPVRPRARNDRHPLWNSPSGRHEIGRAGALTPAQQHRAGYARLPRRTERV